MNPADRHDLTRRIQQAFDLVEVVSEHVRLTRAGKDFKGLCPFHQEKTPSFFVVPSKQIFKCFGCGVGGDVFKFVQLREKVSFPEARAILAAKAGINIESSPSGAPGGEIDRAALARANDWAMRWFQKQLRSTSAGSAARQYAISRGLAPESIEAFGLGHAPDSWDAMSAAASTAGISAKLLVAAGLARLRPDGNRYDTFRNRLMFPIRDAMLRVVGFGGRALGDDPAKYLNTPQTPLFDKASCLYGIDAAKSALGTAGRAVVVEGYLDCVMAHQFGFPNTVATLGTALGAEHVSMLRRYTDSVVLLFDSDEAGERAVQRALSLFLTQRMDVRLARVPEGKDPCDYLLSRGREAFEGVLNLAIDALESKWQQMLQRYHGAGGLESRRRAIQEFLSVVATTLSAGTIDPIQRGLVVNQVATLVGIPAEEVNRLVAGLRSPNEGAAPAASTSFATDSSSPPRATSAVSAATRELLEVLLNEPGYYTSVAPYFDPEQLGDELARSLGRRVCELVKRVGEFDLAELLSEIESVEEARLATDLHLAGRGRQNFAATVEKAVSRLEFEGIRRRADELGALLRQTPETEGGPEAQVRAGLELARRYKHFATRRQLKSLSELPAKS